MSARRPCGDRQPDLFPRSKRPAIALPDNHPMVVLTDTVDWTELERQTEKVREKKLKNAAGRPPHLRATLGALTLMAIRKMPYREAEEQIRYYAPARYLCGLTETDWTPDFTTSELHETMAKLAPQIRHWLRTGFVASGKILNLHIPQLYSIVRGKVGKAVEFGLSWGITRLGGGFALATMSDTKTELVDASYAVRAVEDLKGLFGKAPRGYAYDRAGYSTENVERLRELGVREVGLAPRGLTPWEVEGKVKARLIRERAMVEGTIGTIKCPKYGFNRPGARSTGMMGLCGQRAVLGLNLTKLVRGAAEMRGIALAG